MPAQLLTQFIVSGWWSSPVRPGIHVEVCVTYPTATPPPGWERSKLEVLESLFANAPLDSSLSLEQVAGRAFQYFQSLGGGVNWVRCTEGPCAVLKILDPGEVIP